MARQGIEIGLPLFLKIVPDALVPLGSLDQGFNLCNYGLDLRITGHDGTGECIHDSRQRIEVSPLSSNCIGQAIDLFIRRQCSSSGDCCAQSIVTAVSAASQQIPRDPALESDAG